MNLVIDDILDENIAYYQARKIALAARVLINGRGSIIRRNVKSHIYTYLRRKFYGRQVDIYIGPHDSNKSRAIESRIHKTKKDLDELKDVRHALKRLRVKNMHHEDFTQHIKDLFQLMENEGLWDEGLQLVGSWCFKVYQNFFGVEHYPERTIDIDFAISIPYKGRPVEIGKKLKELGFEEEFNRQDGSLSYVASDIKVEFLKHRKGDGKREGDPYIKDLDIAPQALPYLNILLDNPRTETIKGLGKITVPSMGAFLVHKLIIADERKNEAKKIKDYRQAFAVARRVLHDPEELERMKNVIHRLHKKRQKKMLKSSKESTKYVPGMYEAFHVVLEALGYEQPS